MSFQPVIPFGGYAGWVFLGRSIERQKDAMQASEQFQSQSSYFRETIPSVLTPKDLVNNRRLLSVALSAFGLEGDLNNRAFIEQVLEGGSLREDALANRLSDKRYLQLTQAFGFGDFSVPNTQLSDFSDKILAKYHDKEFITRVGNQNEDLRLALNFQSEIGQILEDGDSIDLGWYKLLGNRPLRQVVEVALGVPAGTGSGNLDRQLRLYQGKLERLIGSNNLAELVDPQKSEKLIRLFLVRSDIAAGQSALSSSGVALGLLQSGGSLSAM